MDKLQIHTNGKVKGPVEIPEISSQFQPSSSQIQPDNHRLDEHQFSHRSQPIGNLQTLESSFARLSFADSNHHQNSNQIPNQVINGGDVDGGYGLPHRRAIYGPQLMYDHWNNLVIGSSSNSNDSVNGSYVNPGEASSSMTHNNGLFNHNLQDYPYPSRYSFFYQNPWDGLTNGFGSGISNTPRNNGSFGYNYDPSSSMNSQNRSILSRAKHPVFSKLLQKTIAESPREVFDTIFKDLIDHVCALIEDAFGHEVVQMLMVNCSSEQITEMVDKVTKYIPGFAQICFNPHGTRVIQLLLRYLHSGDQIWRIVETISRVAYSLARDSNAQLVIMKCFEEFDLTQCSNLVKAIAQNIRFIAKDKNGCIMLQNLLRGYGDLMQPLILAIISNALPLCHDSSGNYVVQLVMDIVDPHVAAYIMNRLRNNYVNLSCDKHGSHVVQKLLQINGIETGWIVRELLQRIDILVVHEFANYVIQTALDVSEEYMFGELWRHIEPNIPLMRCNMYGKKILDKMKLLSIKVERINKFLL